MTLVTRTTWRCSPLGALLAGLLVSAWAQGTATSDATFTAPSAVAPAAAPAASSPKAGTDGTAVTVPSLDSDLALPARWWPAPAHATTAGPAPAIVLLHGCGGAWTPAGRPTLRLRETAAHLQALGVAVLVTDSLTPRGEREICTQRLGARAITQTERRRDALGALRWLAARPDVDPRRLGLIGWSHGGSTVLAATNQEHPEVAAQPLRPALAAAYYPGCQADLARGYRPTAPLLMQVGGADDWTPPQPCERLAAATAAAGTRIVVYPGAYHGFDTKAAVRLRTEVPNGVNPGQGVHVGGQPEARAASHQVLEAFVRERFGLGPALPR